jgi:hypothetical protein
VNRGHVTVSASAAARQILIAIASAPVQGTN